MSMGACDAAALGIFRVVGVGVLSHVLPTATAAPQLAALPAAEGYNWNGFGVMATPEGKLAEAELFAADVRSTAQHHVLCKALELQLPQLCGEEVAAAVAPRGVSSTPAQLLFLGGEACSGAAVPRTADHYSCAFAALFGRTLA
jgi:hypothetical protein